MLPEYHTLLSQPVNIWRAEFLLTIAAQITVPKVVGKYKYYVWK
jgi:hypothetical protein